MGSFFLPWRAARVRSVPAASDGSTGRSIPAAIRESRPNRVKNQGAPAARKTSWGEATADIRSPSRSPRALSALSAPVFGTGCELLFTGRIPVTRGGRSRYRSHRLLFCCYGGCLPTSSYPDSNLGAFILETVEMIHELDDTRPQRDEPALLSTRIRASREASPCWVTGRSAKCRPSGWQGQMLYRPAPTPGASAALTRSHCHLWATT